MNEGEFHKRIYRKFIDYQMDPPQKVTQQYMLCHDVASMIYECKKEIAHAIFSGDLDLRVVLLKWFGKFGDAK